MSDGSRNPSEDSSASGGLSAAAFGEVFEAFRAYLLAVADRELDADLRAKGGASDIVQETFMEAHREITQFHGTSDEELRAWLRRLLLNNVSNFRRRYQETEKRATGREVAVESFGSSGNWGAALSTDSATPSVNMMIQERDVALERAMERLPADYREIIHFRYRDELPFEEIAVRMNRSKATAWK